MKRRALSVLLVILMFFLSSCTKNDIDTLGSNDSNNIPTSIIEVTSVDGKASIVDLKEMAYVTGNGGLKKSTGTIVGPGKISGPKLLDILAIVGGIEEGQSVELIANDGYKMTLTYEQINGDVPSYDENGEAVTTDGLEAIIALEFSDNFNLPSEPTIAFIGETLTDGQLWLRGIKEIKIIE